MFRIPVFGRKSNAPELRARRGKFQADFRFVAANRSEKNDVALLRFRSALVLQLDGAAAGKPRLQKDKRAVRVDGKRFRFFIKGRALRVFAVNAHGYLHQHALAAAARTGTNGSVWALGHASSLNLIYRAKTAFFL